MLPPTPTYIPPGTAIPINLEAGFWDTAPRIVGLWGQFRDYTPVLQVILMAFMLGALAWTILKFLRGISEEEA